MLRRLLFFLVVLLVALALADRFPRGGAADPSSGAALDSAGGDLTLQSGALEPRRRPPLDLPGFVPLDSLARATVRIRLAAEVERHFLDSLFAETDSIVRHWPGDNHVLKVAIVAGGAAGFTPEMVADVRWALDAWHPSSIGLRWLDEPDTSRADFLVRWADTLAADRAGVTDVTWDRGGRIRRAELVLATRSPSTGRPLPLEGRRAVALHEVGHALGLPHSGRAADVMYPIATITELTDRDRFSLRLLYELPTGFIGTVAR